MVNIFKCVECGAEKPHTLEFFDISYRRKNGDLTFRKTCKECRKMAVIGRKRAQGVKVALRPIDIEGNMRQCYCCHEIKELNTKNFGPHHRGLNLRGKCLDCDRVKGRERGREDRYLISKRWQGYRKRDRARGLDFDLTKKDVAELMKKPCVYCGTHGDIGADRIDNEQGHNLQNIVPCCFLCNQTRSNNFTHEEMFLLGEVIALIKKKRSF